MRSCTERVSAWGVRVSVCTGCDEGCEGLHRVNCDRVRGGGIRSCGRCVCCRCICIYVCCSCSVNILSTCRSILIHIRCLVIHRRSSSGCGGSGIVDSYDF